MFDHLAQYASYHVDSKEKKSDCFLRGLNLRMQDKLSTSLDSMPDYNCAVSLALTTEAKMVALEASLKRKVAPEVSNPGAAQRTRVVYRIPARPNYRPPKQQQQPWVRCLKLPMEHHMLQRQRYRTDAQLYRLANNPAKIVASLGIMLRNGRFPRRAIKGKPLLLDRVWGRSLLRGGS
jgi:hypothetical protein